MLPRKSRIGKKGLAEVLRVGKTLRTTFFSIKYAPSKISLQSAVVVSKKTAKSAVVRNRLRRAAYRALAPHISQKSGRMVLFVQKVPPAPLTPAFALDLAPVWEKVTDTKQS